MKLTFPSDVADLFGGVAHSFGDVTHFFKCDEVGIASDMTMCTECLKESALAKNGAGESALRRRASCNRPFQVV